MTAQLRKNKVNWDGNGLVCSSMFLSVHPNCVDPLLAHRALHVPIVGQR